MRNERYTSAFCDLAMHTTIVSCQKGRYPHEEVVHGLLLKGSAKGKECKTDIGYGHTC